jgi:hypothetical protein
MKLPTVAGMQAKKTKSVVGWFLLAAGLLTMASASLIYTRKSYTAKLSSIELSIGDKQRAYLFIWVGIAGLLTGGGILLTRPKNVA